MAPNTHFQDYPFESNYLQLEGGQLHYVDEGEGPVVVMVHGNPTWSFYFRHLITLLRKSHRVVAIDHMGCGLSDKPQNYAYCLAQHIQNLESLLSHLKIDTFSMVVHDWGGAIGMGCAVNNIQNIQKIVVLNSAAFRSSRIPFRIQLCRLPVIGEIIVRLFNGFAWPAQFMAVKNKMSKAVTHGYLRPYDNWHNRIAIHRFVQDIPLKPNHKSYRSLVEIVNKLVELRNANVPLQLIWGGGDFCFNRFFYEEWLSRFPKAEAHYFPDGGHYILEDKGQEIAPLIKSFFQARLI